MLYMYSFVTACVLSCKLDFMSVTYRTDGNLGRGGIKSRWKLTWISKSSYDGLSDLNNNNHKMFHAFTQKL